MANQRILKVKTTITNRASNLQESATIPEIEKSFPYIFQSNDVLRITNVGLRAIPLNNLAQIKFIRLEARYTQDDPSALPNPIAAGDFAPFTVRENGVLYDSDASGGVYEKHGSVTQLEVATPYTYAPIEISYVIVG